MKRSTLYTIAVIAGIAALFFIMTSSSAKVTCEVCMDFRGRSNCASASGVDEAQATETARSTACGPIASGMDESIACGNTVPVTNRCRRR